mmetsp:Transcript_44256/g.112097  ORF Transcript_44256/g.112097 Transcript_44256/m.112097 type:complete len:209 (+) Transcript_44256:924-1550(+)
MPRREPTAGRRVVQKTHVGRACGNHPFEFCSRPAVDRILVAMGDDDWHITRQIRARRVCIDHQRRTTPIPHLPQRRAVHATLGRHDQQVRSDFGDGLVDLAGVWKHVELGLLRVGHSVDPVHLKARYHDNLCLSWVDLCSKSWPDDEHSLLASINGRVQAATFHPCDGAEISDEVGETSSPSMCGSSAISDQAGDSSPPVLSRESPGT